MPDWSDAFGLRNRPVFPAKWAAELPPGLKPMLERGKAHLLEPFKGVTTGGVPQPGLFTLQGGATSLQPVVDAATAWLDRLTPAQRAAGMFPVDAAEWRAWCNVHPFMMHHGVCLDDLAPEQRAAALALLQASLSAAGFETAHGVMKLNEYVRELTGRVHEFGEWFYWVSIMGVPSRDEPWGWQVDGHHLNVNCFVLKDQLVLTPMFMGSEPVFAKSGTYAGTDVFAKEQSLAFALMQALEPRQRSLATVGTKTPHEVLAGAFNDNLVLDYQGIRHGDLTDGQQDLLLELIDVYVGRIRPDHARVKLAEVKRSLADTRFAWIGPCEEGRAFYYRIHSPVVLIEYDQLPGLIYDNDTPSPNHVHTIVRTPNGNDYGKDLLRQHYARHDHSHGHGHHHAPHRRDDR